MTAIWSSPAASGPSARSTPGRGWSSSRSPRTTGSSCSARRACSPFDAERRGTTFEKPCPACGAFYDVLGVTPPYLRGVTEPILEGLFRTDLEFGSGPIQHPLIVAGMETYAEMQAKKFKKFSGEPVEA